MLTRVYFQLLVRDARERPTGPRCRRRPPKPESQTTTSVSPVALRCALHPPRKAYCADTFSSTNLAPVVAQGQSVTELREGCDKILNILRLNFYLLDYAVTADLDRRVLIVSGYTESYSSRTGRDRFRFCFRVCRIVRIGFILRALFPPKTDGSLGCISQEWIRHTHACPSLGNE